MTATQHTVLITLASLLSLSLGATLLRASRRLLLRRARR